MSKSEAGFYFVDSFHATNRKHGDSFLTVLSTPATTCKVLLFFVFNSSVITISYLTWYLNTILLIIHVCNMRHKWQWLVFLRSLTLPNNTTVLIAAYEPSKNWIFKRFIRGYVILLSTITLSRPISKYSQQVHNRSCK